MPNGNIEEVMDLLKKSPHWREDFSLEEVEDKGIKVYRIKAKDSSSETHLAILKLNEVLTNN